MASGNMKANFYVKQETVQFSNGTATTSIPKEACLVSIGDANDYDYYLPYLQPYHTTWRVKDLSNLQENNSRTLNLYYME